MKRFAVIGLGRFGQKLAIALAMSGAEVIAIDKNRDEIELIRDQVSHAVRLDSTDEENPSPIASHQPDLRHPGISVVCCGRRSQRPKSGRYRGNVCRLAFW